MGTKIALGLLLAVTAVYAILVAWFSVGLFRSGSPIGIGLAVGVLLVLALSLTLIGRELLFGRRVEQFGRRLAAEGKLLADDLPRSPGGRIDRSAADAAFADLAADAERNPADPGAWFRLATAYDASGDRKRARAAMRTALRVHAEQADRPR